jgi:hypothetical protein
MRRILIILEFPYVRMSATRNRALSYEGGQKLSSPDVLPSVSYVIAE